MTFLLAAALAVSSSLASAETSSELDMIAASFYPADEPGAAVLVVKNGDVLLRKGYGLADLELQIPIEPDMVFRIGSVTKQFTAAAILLLEERGKLRVSDDIRKYLPDYPTGGRTVTIEHLLTHTSGIRSYTDMPDFGSHARDDMSVAELVALFRDEPLGFEPGEKWAYNNSGFVLLGAIIEKASGESYEDFVRENIFEPLGMGHSYYGSASRIIPRRAKGYDRQNGSSGSFVNSEFLSMTLPYAAGSLLSSVDDLEKWNRALDGTTLLSRASLEKWWQPYRLADGSSTHYGYGWGIYSYEGHTVVGHGGGINGFLCDVLRVADEGLYVAVLTNRVAEDADPGLVAWKLAAAAMGKPFPSPKVVSLEPAAMQSHVGLYRVNDTTRYLVSSNEGRLQFRRFGDENPAGGRTRNPGPDERWNRETSILLPVSESEFAVEGSLARARFEGDRLSLEEHGIEETATRTDEPFDDRSRVLAAIQILFDGMTRGDRDLMQSVLDPKARLLSTETREGRPSTQDVPLKNFLDRVAGHKGPTLREVTWDPKVELSDNLASVWVPYALYVGDELNHCGEDAFQLARTDIGWPGFRIIAIADTRRTEGCEGPPR